MGGYPNLLAHSVDKVLVLTLICLNLLPLLVSEGAHEHAPRPPDSALTIRLQMGHQRIPQTMETADVDNLGHPGTV